MHIYGNVWNSQDSEKYVPGYSIGVNKPHFNLKKIIFLILEYH